MREPPNRVIVRKESTDLYKSNNQLFATILRFFFDWFPNLSEIVRHQVVHKNNPMRKSIFALISCLLSGAISAQESNRLSIFDNWSARVSVGIQSFNTSGIPKSRNQFNYEELGKPNESAYEQESRIVGLATEFSLFKELKPNFRLGTSINFFRDDDEYWSESDITMNVQRILSDSLQSLSIRNLQSYANLGLTAEYDLFLGTTKKHKVSFGLSSGLSINRTPSRTEFDLGKPEGYVESPISEGSEKWYITHTRFNNGLYVMPVITYGINIKKRQWLHFSVATSTQWHSTSQHAQLLNKVSSGELEESRYRLNAIQLKIGYSF